MDKPALISLTFDDGLRCQFGQAVRGFRIDILRSKVFIIEYGSLSGTQYRTTVDWPGHVMRTRFEVRPTG
jgi:hypothetical protein